MTLSDYHDIRKPSYRKNDEGKLSTDLDQVLIIIFSMSIYQDVFGRDVYEVREYDVYDRISILGVVYGRVFKLSHMQ